MKKILLVSLLVTGCAGVSRSCSSFNAEALGASWLVVQYSADGHAMRCWRLSNASISNENNSDGIYWRSTSGHLVHISGWYNRVQVNNEDYAGAARELDINLEDCK